MKTAEEHKEHVLRIFLELQEETDSPNVYHIVDKTCLQKKNIETKFKLNDQSSGFYLFALSTEARDMDKINRSLRKIQSGEEEEEDEEAPIMPVYVGYPGKLTHRFSNHEAYGKCRKYMERRWNDQYHVYLLVVEMDKPMARAMETMMLCNFDFAVNIEENDEMRLPHAVDAFFQSLDLMAIKSPVRRGKTFDLLADVAKAESIIAGIPLWVASIFSNCDQGAVAADADAVAGDGEKKTSSVCTRKRSGPSAQTRSLSAKHLRKEGEINE